MNEGTDPNVLFAVGAVGVIGTLAGVFLNDGLARKREKRVAEARQRRALTAVVGELLDAVSIFDSAISRKAWWPLMDSPRDRAWQEYSDDLAEMLNEEQWNQVRMTYETHRSLNALRETPQLQPAPSESPAEHLKWGKGWPDAPSAADDSVQATWAALKMLRTFRK
jgi:hypothetical protein